MFGVARTAALAALEAARELVAALGADPKDWTAEDLDLLLDLSGLPVRFYGEGCGQ